MGRIVITNVDEGVGQPISERSGLSSEGRVESAQVVGDDRPIHLWKHKLAPGAMIRWESLPQGRVVFLWEGSVTANGRTMSGEGAVMVEHGAACEARAGDKGCELVEFQAVNEETRLPGGHVHVLSQEQAPHAMMGKVGEGAIGARSYADSGCPTCELWLHENSFEGHYTGSRHFHDQDEIITHGTMMVGTVELKRGAVLAIDRNLSYSFGTGDEHLTFINFRPGPSSFVRYSKEGKQPPKDEQQMMRSLLKTNPQEVLAALG